VAKAKQQRIEIPATESGRKDSFSHLAEAQALQDFSDEKSGLDVGIIGDIVGQL
jgi:hypothetical protein